MISNTIFVDLDGTLIKTDLLFEAVLKLLKEKLFFFFIIPFWLMRGKCHLKQQLAKHVNLDAASLPYNLEVLTWLKQQKQQGKKLILITASQQSFAEHINAHLQLFDEVHGTTHLNLKGKRKLDYINQLIDHHDFMYLGNDQSDLIIWQNSKEAVCVNTPSRLLKKALKLSNVIHVFSNKSNTKKIKSWINALRVHQYTKNLLIFVPLILDRDLNWPDIRTALLGFIAFSLLASSVYIINDLLDLENDRKHPIKSKRSFASGEIPIQQGIIVSGLLIILAMLFAFNLSLQFKLVMLIYYTVTLAYSLSLKSLLLIDVFTLAGLYTLRILAGMTFVPAPYSEWLLMFSIFFFYSLAVVKRYTELQNNFKEAKKKIIGRAYRVEHISILQTIGTVSGILACLVFALYLSSEQAASLYVHPKFLYGVCIVLLFWISRIWILAAENSMNEDPVFFAVKDKVSYFCMLLITAIILLAR